MSVRDVLAEARRWGLGGDCLAALAVPAEPGRFVVLVNDDYPCSTPVDWYGHGLTTLAVELESGQLRKLHAHRFNNRITVRTPVRLAGPVAGSALVRTSRDLNGLVVLGTVDHRAAVVKPWGTALCPKPPRASGRRWAGRPARSSTSEFCPTAEPKCT